MSRSLRHVLDRAILRTVVVTSTAVVAIGLFVSLGSAVRQDDAEATALAHNLAQELEEGGHANARVVLAKETAELALGTRLVDAWDGSKPLARAADDRTRDDCAFVGAARACRASVGSYHVVVTTPLERYAELAAPVAIAVLLTALLCAILLFASGRRSARAAIVPLLRLEDGLREAKALPRSDEIAESWGLAEVDSLASALRAALARAELATARETRFVADAAHELRTPLTRLRAQLDLVADDPSLGTDARERTARALGSTSDLIRLTESLLAMARGELPDEEPVDLSDTAEAVVGALDEAQRARVTTEIAPDAIVAGEPALLELALRNLVENALLHTATSVRIVVVRTEDAVVLDVVDDGAGISEGELERVKVAFVRGTRSAPGSGIGLALVEHVAELHRGSLSLANRSEGGLRARLHVPAWTAPARAAG